MRDKEGGGVQTRTQTHLKLDRMFCHSECLKTAEKYSLCFYLSVLCKRFSCFQNCQDKSKWKSLQFANKAAGI